MLPLPLTAGSPLLLLLTDDSQGACRHAKLHLLCEDAPHITETMTKVARAVRAQLERAHTNKVAEKAANKVVDAKRERLAAAQAKETEAMNEQLRKDSQQQEGGGQEGVAPRRARRGSVAVTEPSETRLKMQSKHGSTRVLGHESSHDSTREPGGSEQVEGGAGDSDGGAGDGSAEDEGGSDMTAAIKVPALSLLEA